MRYFIEFNKDNFPIGYAIQNKDVIGNRLREVEPRKFKEEMKKMGVDYILPDDKIENNTSDIFELAETSVYLLEDSTMLAETTSDVLEDFSITAEMLVYALEEIENLKLEIETLKGGN